jgi:hypothetical protein
MRPFRLFALCLLLSPPATAQREVVPGPDAGTRRFGTSILALPNGNYLVTDPEWSARCRARIVPARSICTRPMEARSVA